jgi:hypothetical protein
MMLLGAEPTAMIIQIITVTLLVRGKMVMMDTSTIHGNMMIWIGKNSVDYFQ